MKPRPLLEEPNPNNDDQHVKADRQNPFHPHLNVECAPLLEIFFESYVFNIEMGVRGVWAACLHVLIVIVWVRHFKKWSRFHQNTKTGFPLFSPFHGILCIQHNLSFYAMSEVRSISKPLLYRYCYRYCTVTVPLL